MTAGNLGNARPMGQSVSEPRIDYSLGCWTYFKTQGRTIVVLLASGDKRSQNRDIETVLRLAQDL
ncbi:MAG: hypothetical protein OXF40_10015 [Rhodospirillales bacterium]|nr:hypothetical protein [Rhodospirillales bacterium]